MAKDNGSYFVSPLGVSLALIFGGGGGFTLYALGADPGTPALHFLASDKGFAWFVVTMAQTAVWGLVLFLTWKKIFWLFKDALMCPQRVRAIISLVLYLAAYVIVWWFPLQLLRAKTPPELAARLEQIVPFTYSILRAAILLGCQLAVVLVTLAGIWLLDWRIRNKISADGDEDKCLSALFETRSDIFTFGAVLTTLAAFSFLSSVLWVEALAQYVHPSFNQPKLVYYIGLYFSLLVAIPFVPAYFNLVAAGREVRDRFYPRLSPGAPGYADRESQRTRVDELLNLRVRVSEGLKILTTIFVPVATSLIYTFLGMNSLPKPGEVSILWPPSSGNEIVSILPALPIVRTDMFTGIISDVGVVESIEAGTNLNRLRIACSYPAGMALGASIACSGPCLTVIACGESGNRRWFEADIGAETLARTTARHWNVGTRLNLELPLKLGDELGGHLVTGHVDGVAEIVGIEDFDGMRRIDVRAPDDLARFIAEKGSVALDGTSLTVNRVEAGIFSVLLIPHTLRVTTWDERRLGDEINLEVDLIARYAARFAGTSMKSCKMDSCAYRAASVIHG